MPNTTEEEVIRKLKDLATRGEPNGIDVTYRVTGGSPAEQQVDEEIQLSGLGRVKARVHTPAAITRESSGSLPAAEVNELLLQIGEGASELIPRSEARFIPDSIVGQISVKIEGLEASFFFLADDEQAKQHGKVLSPKAAAAVGSLVRLHKRILHI